MLNFIAMIVCITAAIVHAYQGNIGWLIVTVVMALCNLPFVIKWFKEL